MFPSRTNVIVPLITSLASDTHMTVWSRVFAFIGNKVTMAVDFEGRILWHRSLGTFDNYHGTAGSPLLYKDKLILFQDHSGGSGGGAFVAALDAATGRTLWRTARRASVGWSTPIALHTLD